MTLTKKLPVIRWRIARPRAILFHEILKHNVIRAMKLSTILLLIGCLSASARGYTQTLTINEKDAPISRVFREIKKQTGYNFVYFDSDIRPTQRVTVQVHNSSLEDVLQLCLKDQPVTYKIVNRSIILSKKNTSSFRQNAAQDSAKRDVSGRLITAAGDPVWGASVFIKGMSKGTQSNEQGRFRLPNVPEGAVVVVSYVGYSTLELTARFQPGGAVRLTGGSVSGSSGGDVTIIMQPATRQMDEVLVVPYGTQSRSSYTGSAVTVQSEQLEDRSRPSYQQSLQGNVAGLQVMEATGQPGAAPSVRLRGISSFSGINTPLYVVDGVPMLTQEITTLATSSNSGAGINPNDIESITVLKDASAAAIYGSQGANGVILITTKKGSAGRTKISASANYGINQMATSARNKPLSTEEMTSMLVEGVINRQVNGITTPEAAREYLINQGLNPDVNTDWMDVITQTGQYQQYNLSASGGNEKTKFFLSGGYYKQDAVTRGQWFDRKTGRLSVNHKASKRLSFNGSMNLASQRLSTVPAAGLGQNPVRSLYRLVPWLSPYTENGDYNPLITHNPVIVQNENKYETSIYQAIGNVGAQLQLTDYLSAESKLGIDLHYSDDYRYWSPLWSDGRGSNGRGAEYSTLWHNWTISNLLKFNKQIGGLGINATVGQEAARRNLKRVSTQANNFAAEDLFTLSNASEPYVAWSYKAAATLASYFVNTSFNYDQKYYVNLTGRRDGSSRFGSLVRWANFWSAGAAWNIDKENFMMNAGWIDRLKLRVSYGLSGSQLGDYYGAQGYLLGGNNYMNNPGFIIAQIESGTLTWEENRPLDIGLEFEFLHGRLSGAIDWYTRRTDKLFQDMPVPMENGVTSLNFNVGAMKNYGWEFTLNGQVIKPRQAGGFEWNSSFNISTQKNKILKYQDSSMVQGVYLRAIGGDFYQYYLRGYAGVDPETGEALWYTNASKSATTNVFSQAAAFKQEGKSALASFFGGFTNTFSYKGLSLSTLIYFNWGNQIYDTWGQYTQSDGSGGLSETAQMSRMTYENHWKKPGDIAQYPKIMYRGNQSGLAGQSSTRFLYDGSYIRLREVTLTYQLPLRGRITEAVKGAQVYVRGNNLYTYIRDPYLPYDPEVGIDGILDQNLPISRQFAVGVNLTL